LQVRVAEVTDYLILPSLLLLLANIYSRVFEQSELILKVQMNQPTRYSN
jgi:hypothetical protein